MTNEIARDHESCAWADPSKSIAGMFFCRRKKYRLLPADKGTGICPCQDYIRRQSPQEKQK